MKKALMIATVVLPLVAGNAFAEKVRDWHELDETHKHVVEAIRELDKARAANHYDMAGHGAKAEVLLHDAEKELREAIEASKHAK